MNDSRPRTVSPGPALFLDRDGVINIDHGYVHRIDQFEFVPGIFSLARFAVQTLGWPIVVITNQAGIGRGYFDEAQYEALTHWMRERFEKEGAPISRVYHCPYHPEHGLGEYRMDHPWRKPNPGMIFQAAADLGLDLPNSALIGNSMSDIMAAAAAGIRLRIRIGSLDDRDAAAVSHDVVGNLEEALVLLAKRTGSPVLLPRE